MYRKYLLTAAVPCVVATRNCGSCIPLHDLLSPAYGLVVRSEGLSSAKTYYNGSSELVASIKGSDEYHRVMENALSDAMLMPSSKVKSTRCDPRPLPLEDPDEHSSAYQSWSWPHSWSNFANPWHSGPAALEAPPLSDMAKLFKSEIERLAPFDNNPFDLTISVVVPSYFVGTKLECDVRSAAESLVRTVESVDYPPAAAFTAYGYDICRVSSDWFPCNLPERMLVLETVGSFDIVVASTTPPAFLDGVAFATHQMDDDPPGLVTWLNGVIQTHRPSAIAHIGTRTDRLSEGIANSQAKELMIDQSIRAPVDAVVVGAAHTAKELLGRIVSDCIEDQECLEIREEADRIAGSFRPLWHGIVNEEKSDEYGHNELK